MFIELGIVIWWLIVGVIVYHHFLYPMMLNLLVKRSAESEDLTQESLDYLPSISVVIPCYNEADVIAEKMRNFSFIDYPADRLDVILVNDGSTDATQEIIEKTIHEPELSQVNFILVDNKINRGKVTALNETLKTLNQGIVVLSDTSALISVDAFKRIAQHFQAQSVGVVCATYQFLNETSKGEARYWQYQRGLKSKESATGSTLGAHGALYAFRALSNIQLPSDTINDDFVLPMRIVQQGFRCVYDTQIVAVELEEASSGQDQARRQRIAAGNLQQAIRLSPLLHPRFGWVAVNFFSGKWLRAFMPFLLVALLVMSSIFQSVSTLIGIVFVAQALVYALALVRHYTAQLSWPRAIDVIYYLVSGYVASLLGGIHYLVNPQHFESWKRISDEPSANTYMPASTLILKRGFDVLVALVGLFLTLPLWPLLALAIRLESRGPVFFKQLRVGRSMPRMTELFYMIKFRTMAVNAEEISGAVWATENDPRITRVGRFLRKSRLDELPQLLNVLSGEMSLVGPRPERPSISRDLDAAIPYYAERTFYVSPGITGFAQVNQGYDTNLDDVKSKLLYDHAYAVSLSSVSAWIRMDIFVMFKTVWVMVAGRGQ